jgi:hypothetical protein
VRWLFENSTRQFSRDARKRPKRAAPIARARRDAALFFLTKIHRAHYIAEVSKLRILSRTVSN